MPKVAAPAMPRIGLALRATVDGGTPHGIDLAAAVLAALWIDGAAMEGWSRRQRERARGDVRPAEAA